MQKTIRRSAVLTIAAMLCPYTLADDSATAAPTIHDVALAGPFIDGAPKRGLSVFSVDTLEEAESLVKTDPTVVAGIFTYQLTKLYASAALMQVNEIHGTIQKTPVD